MRPAAILAVVAIILAAALLYFQPRVGDVVETWPTENSSLKIRIENRAEDCVSFCLPGAYYVFLASPKGIDGWRHIMTFRHDDPGPIQRHNVRFVGERVAFVFMGWVFAVTIDAGGTWTIWNAQEDLPKWECCNYRLIKDVQIAADGTGVMNLSVIPGRRGEVPELRTTDFGRHWRFGR